MGNGNSLLVISNDKTSQLIEINENTNIGDFYQKIILKFPNINNMKLFYYEGYSHNKLYVSNEQEYVTANKKCIEYFYLCPENSYEENDKIDYLKYHSVLIFSPIKKLNSDENNQKRKSMQIINNNDNIHHHNSSNNINFNNNNMFVNNNNMSNINNNVNMLTNNFNAMNLNNFNNPMNNMQNFGTNNNFMMNNMMGNNSMMRNNNMMGNNIFMNNNMMGNNFMMNNNMMGNNIFMNNNMSNIMMNNNMGNFNINNFNNPITFLNYMNNIMYTNPNLFFFYMRQINPQFLQNWFNSMNNNNNFNNFPQQNQLPIRKMSSQQDIPSPTIVPEYETIDIESNPMNKYIENAINFSFQVKQEILLEKQNQPNNFINIESILSSPGLLSSTNPSTNDYKYILCLIGKILKNKNIEVGIYKDNQEKDRIDLSSIQFIFSGLINKKKYMLCITNNIDEDLLISVVHDLSYRKNYIEEWKRKISKRLKINKNLIILTNPRNSTGHLHMDLAFNPKVGIMNEKSMEKELKKDGINEVIVKPLLEGCRLSKSIFNSNYNKYYNIILNNQKRGGEQYIQPLNWTVYGMNVSGKYDFGDDRWLGNKNGNGEFAVAYYGINNLVNKNINLMKSIMSIMGNLETGNTFVNVKNARNPQENCKSGAYFYKNPEHAENSSEIIKIAGFEYKIMFMCRVKPSKIMQPENFKDCWILSPTPDEVRPYKILIKKIPKSPLAIQSTQVIQMCKDPSPPPIYFQILSEKNESFYQKKFNGYPNLSDFDYALKIYSQASTINTFLRNPINPTIDNKSNVWCLHKAIVKNVNNVQNGTVVYRGVCFKLPNDIGIGTKFYFPEFLSTSTDINIAKDIALSGTLMYITIQNNGVNGKKVYCRNIEYISDYPFQKEILFTSYCKFRVTKIQKTPNLDLLYLTCEGHDF